MITWAIALFVVGALADILGFGGVAAAAAGIAKILMLPSTTLASARS